MPKVYAETQLVGIIGVFGIGAIVDLVSLSFLHFRLDEAFDYLQDRPEIINRVVRLFLYATFPALPIGFSRKDQSHDKTVTSSNATKSFREVGSGGF